MPQVRSTRASQDGRRAVLLARTALCSALGGLGLLAPAAGLAAPVGGTPEVGPGGGAPTINQSGLNTSVTLNAPRTVLNWNSFDVTPEESVTFNFGARNWIVLNRILGLSTTKIEGVVEGKVGAEFGGNVWFASQNSVIFGKGSRVDVGGLLVGIGSLDSASFLDPANNTFSFSGSDVVASSRIHVLAGAQVTAHGGSALFVAPTIQTRANALVSAASGSVLYGSAKTYRISLAPGTGGDFDMIDFVVASAADGSESALALDLAAGTQANTVFVAAVNRSNLGTAVINLEGLITATAAKADGGDIVLSGGGGVANRLPGPALPGAAATDVYLNRASASRDLQIRNTGHIYARPWERPPQEFIDPPTLADDAAPPEPECDPFGNCGFGNGFGAPLETVVLDQALISSLFDPTAVSSISTGRDAKIAATASIELGRVVSGRDMQVTGPEVRANDLVAAGALNVASSEGDVLLASVGAMQDGVITAQRDVKVDAVSASQKLTVSGRDVTLGDGVSSATGGVTLSATRDVLVDLAAAKIDTSTAGGSVTLRGGAIEVAAVSAPRVFAQSASAKLDNVTTAGDLYVVATNGSAIVGNATAGDDIFVLATHGTASLTNATITGAGADIVGADFAGNPDAAGNGRVVRVESSDFDAQLGLAAGGVTGATAVAVRAGQDAFVEVTKETPGAFSVVAARDATLRAPSVRLDTVTSGRDLTIGSTVGDFTLSTNLVAVRNITVNAAGAVRVGDVRADSGSVSVIGASVQAGAVTASEDVTLRALTGGVTTTSYRAGRDLILQGATLSLGTAIAPVARDLSITSSGAFTSSSPLSAGRNVTIDVAGKATLGATTGGGVVRIAASDLDLTGLLTGPTVQIESRNGALQVGGGGGSGFVLDNSEFGQIRAGGGLKVYAGLTTGTVRGDLTLQDLAINTANTPNVTFLVGPANNALVAGTAAPTTSGGVLRIGDATDLNWRPSSILITGGLGAATFANGDYTGIRPFDEVRLAARQDIIMGSQRFITLIQGAPPETIDLANLQPAGVAPQGAELLKVFVSTGRLEVSAENKVVQQNAAPTGAVQSVGLVFTGQFRPALIIDPPKVVELWGVFVGQNGQILSGPQANGALTFQIVDAAGNPITQPDGSTYRFNSCEVGTTNCPALALSGDASGAGATDPGIRARDMLGDSGGSDNLSDAGLVDAISSASLTDPPAVLSIAPPDSDEVVTDPVTAGTGSEEIWRKRRQKQ